MKKKIYQGLYALLSALSGKINNRYINSYKMAIGTALLVITSGCQTPKKSNKNEDNKDTLYSDTVETNLQIDENILCYDMAMTDTIKADSTPPPPPPIPVITTEPIVLVDCYVPVDCYVVEEPIDSLQIEEEENQVYQVVEQMPSFPGGTNELINFIKRHLRYPENYGDVCVQGRVIVEFIVEKNGDVTNPVVLRGIERELDKEAIRVVSIFPRFIPGKQNGKPVRVRYVVPVTFKISNYEQQNIIIEKQDTITNETISE